MLTWGFAINRVNIEFVSKAGVTHHDLEVVAGNDLLSVLHPADSRWGVPCDSTLKLDVRGLVGVRVARIVQELRRHCRTKQINSYTTSRL